MLVEELRVGAQVARDVVCVHAPLLIVSMLAFVHRDRGAFHRHRIVAAGPSDGQRAAARLDLHRRIEQPARDAGDHRGAGAGAAGERLAGAALPHAQRDAVAVEHLHVARVHPVGKARVDLDQRPLGGHRRARHVGHDLHRVRVAHRQDGDVEHAGRCTFSRSSTGRDGRAHVHAHLAVGLEARPDRAAQRLDADLALLRQALAVHELHEAARAVAALLDLAAVGVEDAVAEVRAPAPSAARPPGSGRSRRRNGGRR